MSSSAPAKSFPVLALRDGTNLRTLRVATAVLLAIAGVFSIWPVALFLWALWTTDGLKSIGMLIPVASLLLILRAWRSLGWEFRGTWWGLVVLLLTSAAVLVRQQAVLVFVVSPQWAVYLPPHSLVAVCYATGVVLLLGGVPLLRASVFPLVLLWFVNPIPHVFNVLVDLPLQRVSAHVARGFAHALGQPLTPDQMRLMFTPDFGMFIAPGCNGIRGAVTMGFIALVAGYLYRFRWYAHAAIVAAAVLLGYVFNFVRLCLLVVYYIVALHLPRLQRHGEVADYVIGACLFLLATLLLIGSIRRLGESASEGQIAKGQIAPPATARSPSERTRPTSPSLPLRFAALLALSVFGLLRFSDALGHRPAAAAASANSETGQFPEQVGTYRRVRSWNETLDSGTLLFHWADYSTAGDPVHVSVGVSPVIGSHDTLICHSARGEDPLWHGQMTTATAGNARSAFSASFFNDGATQSLEATTLCTGTACGEYTSGRRHLGLVYSRISAASLLTQDPQRPIPILIRAETLDTAMPPEAARAQLTAAVRQFLASLDLRTLTEPYRPR